MFALQLVRPAVGILLFIIAAGLRRLVHSTAANGLDLPLAIRGTPFQRRVWDALLGVRVGYKITYAAHGRDNHQRIACGKHPVRNACRGRARAECSSRRYSASSINRNHRSQRLLVPIAGIAISVVIDHLFSQ